jgi:cobalt-zinc-cadmium efflux system outer membrane protein
MNARIATGIVIAGLLGGAPASGQVGDATTPLAQQFIDAADGVSLEEAIARALAREPALRAARSGIDAARGRREQAAQRRNPSVSFELREEPAGTDSQTTVSAEWPLDLFRRRGRIAVADREVAAAELAVADRHRLLAADVRLRFVEALAGVRDLSLFDEIVAAARGQHELLAARVEAGASPPLDRDLLDVEVRRLQAERLLQAGLAEAATFELKRVIGMKAEEELRVRHTLEELVARELAAGSGSSRLVANAIDDRTDVREAAAQVAVADARIDRARQEGRVDVSLVGSYMRMDAGFPQAGFAPDGSLAQVRGRFHYVSAGAMISLPIVNRNTGEVSAARAERAAAGAAYEAARLTAEMDVATARVRDERARQALLLFEEGARALARQNLSVVRASYELGRVTVFEILAEQRRYLDIERAYSGTLKAAFEARTALKRALGEVQ